MEIDYSSWTVATAEFLTLSLFSSHIRSFDSLNDARPGAGYYGRVDFAMSSGHCLIYRRPRQELPEVCLAVFGLGQCPS
jgi:hypothetical protein